MHIQTHLMSGWCVANTLELTPRERLLAMIAASAADLDGLGLLVSMEHYTEYHHVIGHNLLAGIVLTSVLTAFSVHRARACVLYFGLFHLHLVMDYWGSGPGWGVAYGWPFFGGEFLNENAWHLTSWQNFLAGGFLLVWMIRIAWCRGRTPLEVILPSLDGQIAASIRARRSESR